MAAASAQPKENVITTQDESALSDLITAKFFEGDAKFRTLEPTVYVLDAIGPQEAIVCALMSREMRKGKNAADMSANARRWNSGRQMLIAAIHRVHLRYTDSGTSEWRWNCAQDRTTEAQMDITDPEAVILKQLPFVPCTICIDQSVAANYHLQSLLATQVARQLSLSALATAEYCQFLPDWLQSQLYGVVNFVQIMAPSGGLTYDIDNCPMRSPVLYIAHICVEQDPIIGTTKGRCNITLPVYPSTPAAPQPDELLPMTYPLYPAQLTHLVSCIYKCNKCYHELPNELLLDGSSLALLHSTLYP